MFLIIVVFEILLGWRHTQVSSLLLAPRLPLLQEVVMHIMRCGAMYFAHGDAHMQYMVSAIVLCMMMIGIVMEFDFMHDVCHAQSLWMDDNCSDFFRAFSLFAALPYTAINVARRSRAGVARPELSLLITAGEVCLRKTRELVYNYIGQGTWCPGVTNARQESYVDYARRSLQAATVG